MNLMPYKRALPCFLPLSIALMLSCSDGNVERLGERLELTIGNWVKVAPYGEIVHNHLTEDGRFYGVIYTVPGEHPHAFFAAIAGERQAAIRGEKEHFTLGALIEEVRFLNSYYLSVNLLNTDSLFVPDLDDDGEIDLLVDGFVHVIPARYRWLGGRGIIAANWDESATE
jgi:hypothetical protein